MQAFCFTLVQRFKQDSRVYSHASRALAARLYLSLCFVQDLSQWQCKHANVPGLLFTIVTFVIQHYLLISNKHNIQLRLTYSLELNIIIIYNKYYIISSSIYFIMLYSIIIRAKQKFWPDSIVWKVREQPNIALMLYQISMKIQLGHFTEKHRANSWWCKTSQRFIISEPWVSLQNILQADFMGWV